MRERFIHEYVSWFLFGMAGGAGVCPSMHWGKANTHYKLAVLAILNQYDDKKVNESFCFGCSSPGLALEQSIELIYSHRCEWDVLSHSQTETHSTSKNVPSICELALFLSSLNLVVVLARLSPKKSVANQRLSVGGCFQSTASHKSVWLDGMAQKLHFMAQNPDYIITPGAHRLKMPCVICFSA